MAKRHCSRCGAEVLEGDSQCILCGSTEFSTGNTTQINNQSATVTAVTRKKTFKQDVLPAIIGLGIGAVIIYFAFKFAEII